MARARRVLQLLWLCVAAGAAASEAPAGISPGDDLAEALEKFRAAGARLVYSNALIRPGSVVKVAPDPNQSIEAQLRALLAPYGLTLEATEPDILVVVPREPEPVEPAPKTVVTPPAQPIEELLVTSPRQRLIRDRESAQTLTTRELESIPSAGRDLFRAVSSLPGHASNGISARQRIRGSDSNEVLYLLDGAQFIQPFHVADFFSPFSAVNTNVVDAVQVYNAGYPSRYGNRAGGVVDLHIAEADGPFTGAIDLNLMTLSAHAQSAYENWQWLASARRGTLDLLLPQFQQDYGKPVYHDEMLRVSGRRRSLGWWLGMVNAHDDITLRNPSANEQGVSHLDNQLFWGRLELEPLRRTRLASLVSYNRVRGSREGTLDNPFDAVGTLSESRSIDVFRATLDVTRPVDGVGLLSAGVEYQHHRGAFDGLLQTRYGPLGAPIQPLPGVDRSFDVTRTGDMLAVYAAAAREFGKRLELELGLRYDSQDIDPVHDTRLSPRLSAQFAAGADTTLFLNVGRYVQHQFLHEIPLDDGLLELARPQLVDQIGVAAQHAFSGSTQGRLELYERRIQHPQTRFDNLYNRYVLLPELHADRLAVIPDRARARGVELELSSSPLPALSLRASYVFALVEERMAGDWKPRPWDQRHTFRVGADLERATWRLSMQASYHSGWATTDLISESGALPAVYNEARLPAFVSVDLSASRVWQLGRGELEVYLEASNLTNRRNVGGYRYELGEDLAPDAEPRSLLPILPVLGLKYQW